MNTNDCLFLAGGAAIAAGVAWLLPAAGLIVAGAELVGLGLLLEARKQKRQPRRG